jgi:hypothetical protein
MKAYTVTKVVHFRRGYRDHNQLRRGKPQPPPEGRVPRLSRLMALAIHFEDLVHRGDVRDQATLARFGQVTRARISQIMNLNRLAPDIQEELLFLPKTVRGHDPINPKWLEALACDPDWRHQRQRWQQIKSQCMPSPVAEAAAS